MKYLIIAALSMPLFGMAQDTRLADLKEQKKAYQDSIYFWDGRIWYITGRIKRADKPAELNAYHKAFIDAAIRQEKIKFKRDSVNYLIEAIKNEQP